MTANPARIRRRSGTPIRRSPISHLLTNDCGVPILPASSSCVTPAFGVRAGSFAQALGCRGLASGDRCAGRYTSIPNGIFGRMVILSTPPVPRLLGAHWLPRILVSASGHLSVCGARTDFLRLTGAGHGFYGMGYSWISTWTLCRTFCARCPQRRPFPGGVPEGTFGLVIRHRRPLS